MGVVRRPGASRLIDWTGERCVPWTPDIQVAYEHYHRYLWVASLTRGKRVLDLGSGEGFGSAILAQEARSVQGIDIDERAVAHSQLNYAADNLLFRVGSALALDDDDDAFDVVVSFEVLEHLVEQDEMLEQIDRVLAPDGLLIISTPDRRVYSEATGNANPYHEHELSGPEFRELLGQRFSHVALWGQRTFCGSRMNALDSGAAKRPLTLFVERVGDEWLEAPEPPPMYLVAVASRAAVKLPAAESTLVDYGIAMVRAQERETARARAEAVEAVEAHRELELTTALMAEEIQSADERHKAQLEVLAAQLAEATSDVRRQAAELATAHSQLARYEDSVAWSAFQFVRWKVYSVIGEQSSAARTLQWSLRQVGRMRGRRTPEPTPAEAPAPPRGQIRFPLYTEPIVSIVIPAHAGAELTEACLRTIAANTTGPPYEVIVVDDLDDDANRRLWAIVEGARVIVNDENQGYLRSVNIGAAAARGRYVLPLNNDTLVQPGWLFALVQRAENTPDIGIVAPKLFYPDGALQEAGAIVWQDGSGWNVGRGKFADHPYFNYVRDVDYASGACLLVRADLWREVGGFSERYLPMYYEDTDLCFAAREHGYRVVYEPAAHVVHLEGGTAGTDSEAGGKRYQELNRPKFVERWRDRLAADALPPGERNVRRASDRNRGPHVLVVDHRVPAADRDSGSLRMTQMLRCFVDLGCRVTFIPDNLIRREPYTRELQSLGIEVMYGAVDPCAEITAIGAELALAVVSRPAFASRYFEVLREHAPDASIAYDTVDLHFVREQRRAALGDGRARKVETMREIELGLIRASDVTIAITEEEREIVLSHVPDATVLVVPNANTLAVTVAPADAREGLLFVGSFEHPPNVDAALLLVHAVMPLVWEQVGPVVVKIVGPEPPAVVRELAGPHVEVTGWVKDLGPLYASARVMVAPLTYGAGMKGKVTQSLAAGLPVVTTPIGAEGLDAVDGRDMMIAEDPADLADRIVRLVREDELWHALSAGGRQVASRVSSPAVMRERVEQLLDSRMALR